jgi:hypothetical protein
MHDDDDKCSINNLDIDTIIDDFLHSDIVINGSESGIDEIVLVTNSFLENLKQSNQANITTIITQIRVELTILLDDKKYITRVFNNYLNSISVDPNFFDQYHEQILNKIKIPTFNNKLRLYDDGYTTGATAIDTDKMLLSKQFNNLLQKSITKQDMVKILNDIIKLLSNDNRNKKLDFIGKVKNFFTNINSNDNDKYDLYTFTKIVQHENIIINIKHTIFSDTITFPCELKHDFDDENIRNYIKLCKDVLNCNVNKYINATATDTATATSSNNSILLDLVNYFFSSNIDETKSALACFEAMKLKGTLIMQETEGIVSIGSYNDELIDISASTLPDFFCNEQAMVISDADNRGMIKLTNLTRPITSNKKTFTITSFDAGTPAKMSNREEIEEFLLSRCDPEPARDPIKMGEKPIQPTEPQQVNAPALFPNVINIIGLDNIKYFEIILRGQNNFDFKYDLINPQNASTSTASKLNTINLFEASITNVTNLFFTILRELYVEFNKENAVLSIGENDYFQMLVDIYQYNIDNKIKTNKDLRHDELKKRFGEPNTANTTSKRGCTIRNIDDIIKKEYHILYYIVNLTDPNKISQSIYECNLLVHALGNKSLGDMIYVLTMLCPDDLIRQSIQKSIQSTPTLFIGNSADYSMVQYPLFKMIDFNEEYNSRKMILTVHAAGSDFILPFGPVETNIFKYIYELETSPNYYKKNHDSSNINSGNINLNLIYDFSNENKINKEITDHITTLQLLDATLVINIQSSNKIQITDFNKPQITAFIEQAKRSSKIDLEFQIILKDLETLLNKQTYYNNNYSKIYTNLSNYTDSTDSTDSNDNNFIQIKNNNVYLFVEKYVAYKQTHMEVASETSYFAKPLNLTKVPGIKRKLSATSQTSPPPPQPPQLPASPLSSATSQASPASPLASGKEEATSPASPSATDEGNPPPLKKPFWKFWAGRTRKCHRNRNKKSKNNKYAIRNAIFKSQTIKHHRKKYNTRIRKNKK